MNLAASSGVCFFCTARRQCFCERQDYPSYHNFSHLVDAVEVGTVLEKEADHVERTKRSGDVSDAILSLFIYEVDAGTLGDIFLHLGPLVILTRLDERGVQLRNLLSGLLLVRLLRLLFLTHWARAERLPASGEMALPAKQCDDCGLHAWLMRSEIGWA